MDRDGDLAGMAETGSTRVRVVGSGVPGQGTDIFAAAARRLRRVVPYDAGAWIGTDPATVLPTVPVRVENIEPVHCESYWRREYGVEDALTFRDVARSAHAAGTLRKATGGCLNRSARYREFMRPLGYADNLRAAFLIGENAWGVVDLFRGADRPPFTERDLRHVAALGRDVALSLAGLAVDDGQGRSAAGEVPGTALFDDGDRVTFADAHAERWFAELSGPSWDSPAIPLSMAAVYSVVARARAVDAERAPGPAVVRLRAGSGRWFSIHAAVLRSRRGGPGPVTVVIEPATSSRIVPIIVEAYSLTPRERQVTESVARGHTTSEIAKRLHLSPHTVRDHLKAIFAKVDVNSRGELVAKLFGEHSSPRMHAPGADLVHVDI
jgi:DNA-binding CsgD family transcriptional regulator